jgi:putative ABC transport system permease protein
MTLWACGLREVRRRPGRTLLALLGIALGLGTVVATRLTAHTVSRAYGDLFGDIAGEPALEVSAFGMAPFDPAPLPDLGRIRGVRAVEPRIRGAVSVVGPAGGVTVALTGIDPGRSRTDWPLQEGEPLEGNDAALLDAGLVESLGLTPGCRFKLWGPGGDVNLRLAGTLRPRGTTAGTGGLLIVSLDAARRLLAVPAGHIHCLRLHLEDKADPEGARREAAKQLPPHLVVHPPGANAELARATLRRVELALAALGVLALVTAAFIILNTFLLTLNERRRQFALLKALGATRSQVLRLLLGECLLLGLTGTVLGCVAAIGLAALLVSAVGHFLGLSLPPLELRAGPFLLAGLLGPLLPLGASCWPAWRASRRTVLDELRPRGSEACRSPRRAGVVGLLLLGPGLVPAVGLCRGWFSGTSLALMLALPLLLAGGVLVCPMLLVPLLRVLEMVPARPETMLALRQLARSRTRTGLTAGVLFLGVAVTITFGQSLRGVLAEVRDWYRRTVVADFLVRGSMPDSSFTLAAALPDALGEELARLDGVAAVDRIAFVPAQANGKGVLVLARTFSSSQPLPLDLREGEALAVRGGLLRGEAVLGTGLVGQLRLRCGDDLTLSTPRGLAVLRVAGTASEFAGGGAAVYLEWESARHLLDISGPHIFLIRAGPGAGPALAHSLRAFCVHHGLLLQGNGDLRGLIDRLLARTAGAVWALMLLVFFVAALGIVNTLQMNVEEQAGTFGTLRALGMTTRQVRGVVWRQAVLLAALSLLPGTLGGVGLAYVIHKGAAGCPGTATPFRPDAVVLFISWGAALIGSLFAAVLPAGRAARLPHGKLPGLLPWA